MVPSAGDRPCQAHSSQKAGRLRAFQALRHPANRGLLEASSRPGGPSRCRPVPRTEFRLAAGPRDLANALAHEGRAINPPSPVMTTSAGAAAGSVAPVRANNTKPSVNRAPKKYSGPEIPILPPRRLPGSSHNRAAPAAWPPPPTGRDKVGHLKFDRPYFVRRSTRNHAAQAADWPTSTATVNIRRPQVPSRCAHFDERSSRVQRMIGFPAPSRNSPAQRARDPNRHPPWRSRRFPRSSVLLLPAPRRATTRPGR